MPPTVMLNISSWSWWQVPNFLGLSISTPHWWVGRYTCTEHREGSLAYFQKEERLDGSEKGSYTCWTRLSQGWATVALLMFGWHHQKAHCLKLSITYTPSAIVWPRAVQQQLGWHLPSYVPSTIEVGVKRDTDVLINRNRDGGKSSNLVFQEFLFLHIILL